MPLNLEQIQFIDRYLKNSGVLYDDVRAEFVDHIASALEAEKESDSFDFYNHFKNYMIKHKTDLLKRYEKSETRAFWLILSQLLKKAFNVRVIFVSAVVYAFSYFGIHYTIKQYLILPILLLAIFSVFWMVWGRKNIGKKTLYQYKLMMLIFAFDYFSLQFFNPNASNWNLYLLGFYIWFNVSGLYLYYQQTQRMKFIESVS